MSVVTCCDGPPETSTRLMSVPLNSKEPGFSSTETAKKAIDRLSGDQNGWSAPSVFGIGCASVSPTALTQRLDLPFSVAMKAILLLSGDTARRPYFRPR